MKFFHFFFSLLVVSIFLLLSCNNDNVRPTSCQVCGTWKVDSVIDDVGTRGYFNLDTFPFKRRFYTFQEDKIYYVEDEDTITYTVIDNSVLNPQSSKIIWKFNSENDTFVILNVNNTNLKFNDLGGGGSYQTDYLTKVQ